MEARSQKIRGLNLNPLAPAQSKRTFAFSGKTQKIIRNASISAPFFASFLHLFRDFSGKAEKQVQGPSPGPQKHVKMDLKGAKTEPKNQQSTPQGPTKYKLPRPGARRRRRRSAAVPLAPLAGVLGPTPLRRLTSSRTNKVSSLGACTHLTF